MSQQRPRVLLADDDAGLRAALSSRLSLMGFSVVTASDGVAAIEALDKHCIHAALLDVAMPGLDGFGVCQHIRSKPALRNIPVFFLTGTPDRIVRENLGKLSDYVGGTYCLTKPCDSRAIAVRLLRALAESSQRAQDSQKGWTPRPAAL